MRKFIVLGLMLVCKLTSAEKFPIDIISYENFISEKPEAIKILNNALFKKGIIGIRGIPGYQEKVSNYLNAFRAFCALPEEAKERSAPDHSLGETFLGYERGKEKFQRPDGSWVRDDLKVSYYAFEPDCVENKWPNEIDINTPFQEIASLMSSTARKVMRAIGLFQFIDEQGIKETSRCGRMLHYRKSTESNIDNPYWCGAHYDHGLFTTLLPAFYFVDGKRVEEPKEAGLFVRAKDTSEFKKVVANDPDVLFFQVGEFGQVVSNDAIKATEHRVHKASGNVERFTLALFFDAPFDTVVHSTSELAKDSRYGEDPCTYRRWSEESHKRYIVKEE